MNEKFRIRAKRNDRIARWVITLGGMMIIFSVIFILLLIADTARPLFNAPQAEIFAKFPLSKEPTQQVLGIGVDEYLETGFFIDDEGVFNFFENQQGLATDDYQAPPPTPEVDEGHHRPSATTRGDPRGVSRAPRRRVPGAPAQAGR